MKSKNINQKTGYRTDIDTFIAEFNEKRIQEPLSRQKEIAKHQSIATRRDHPVEDPRNDLWESF